MISDGRRLFFQTSRPATSANCLSLETATRIRRWILRSSIGGGERPLIRTGRLTISRPHKVAANAASRFHAPERAAAVPPKLLPLRERAQLQSRGESMDY